MLFSLLQFLSSRGEKTPHSLRCCHRLTYFYLSPVLFSSCSYSCGIADQQHRTSTDRLTLSPVLFSSCSYSCGIADQQHKTSTDRLTLSPVLKRHSYVLHNYMSDSK
ncbi:hypothetical protein VCUG_00349 [Vavraia culicis subsp. floridensis]|uniref:Uncharacterized protein n=1 Tax=Vavraia culicis (isolate floridensis) TaxID=948595 RepID=L2GWQ8_VAVCU|nr:uncharacterized protein VCUG_00349 [Vavraia culicis subsp. floridensis]ELA48111.1 hypothetical protein VCUG_00349 [Vavraia culicis subsp. floridensis]